MATMLVATSSTTEIAKDDAAEVDDDTGIMGEEGAGVGAAVVAGRRRGGRVFIRACEDVALRAGTLRVCVTAHGRREVGLFPVTATPAYRSVLRATSRSNRGGQCRRR